MIYLYSLDNYLVQLWVSRNNLHLFLMYFVDWIEYSTSVSVSVSISSPRMPHYCFLHLYLL